MKTEVKEISPVKEVKLIREDGTTDKVKKCIVIDREDEESIGLSFVNLSNGEIVFTLMQVSELVNNEILKEE